MPLLRLIAEGVGPFERLDLDFSDGHGNPHLGPHILAGVNGSGKSTALRAIAWAMSWSFGGFQEEEWSHFLRGHPESRALLLFKPPDGDRAGWACSKAVGKGARSNLVDWVHSIAADGPRVQYFFDTEPPATCTWVGLGGPSVRSTVTGVNVAAYAPSRALRHLHRPDRAEKPACASGKCLAFESTVDNEGIQAWLLSLHTRRALAKERGQSTEAYEYALGGFQKALELVCGMNVGIDVDIEPALQLRLHIYGGSFNFSQLPDGVRNTVGWLADFMMRQDMMQWDPVLKGKRPGILLLDEVDAHLHPSWQRKLLPAMRAALPHVQIIVTSHSPFVISSCRGARVHVLDLKDGQAYLARSEDVPFGESVTATLREIFGVSSRFDVDTEKKLEEWNELSRQEAVGPLSRADTRRLEKLTAELGGRSEELRSIVGVRQLPGRNSKAKPSKRRQRLAG